MSDPEPTETERLIQATREEAQKIRTLLLWLLVGIPVAAGLIWGLVALAAMNSASDASSSDTTPAAVDTGTYDLPTTTYDAPTTTVPPAIANFTVTDSTMCSAIDDWTGYRATPVNPADAGIENGSVYVGDGPLVQYLTSKGDFNAANDVGSLTTQCIPHSGLESFAFEKDETVLAAWQQVQDGGS